MDVFQYPNPALKVAAAEVEVCDRETRRLVRRMIKTMRDAPGVGLAATQLGVQQRIIVFQIDEDGDAVGLVNPRIVESSEETCIQEEGCLSFPGVAVMIERPTSVVCEGIDASGEPMSIEADDLLARVLQHEIDHLDGVLIIDRASPEDRLACLKDYREIHRL